MTASRSVRLRVDEWDSGPFVFVRLDDIASALPEGLSLCVDDGKEVTG